MFVDEEIYEQINNLYLFFNTQSCFEFPKFLNWLFECTVRESQKLLRLFFPGRIQCKKKINKGCGFMLCCTTILHAVYLQYTTRVESPQNLCKDFGVH